MAFSTEDRPAGSVTVANAKSVNGTAVFSAPRIAEGPGVGARFT